MYHAECNNMLCCHLQEGSVLQIGIAPEPVWAPDCNHYPIMLNLHVLFVVVQQCWEEGPRTLRLEPNEVLHYIEDLSLGWR